VTALQTRAPVPVLGSAKFAISFSHACINKKEGREFIYSCAVAGVGNLLIITCRGGILLAQGI